MEEKNKINVTIADKQYTILSSDNPKQVHRAGIFLDKKFSEVRLVSQLSNDMIMVLVALNLSNDLLKAQDENMRLRKDLALIRKNTDEADLQF